jgi:hypothetical protein
MYDIMVGRLYEVASNPWALGFSVGFTALIMWALLSSNRQAQRNYERRLALQQKYEALFSHLPEGEKVIMVAKAMKAERSMIRPENQS